MTGQVKKKVDAVGANAVGQLMITESGGVTPEGRGGAQARRQRVIVVPVRIADRLNLAPIEIFQNSNEEVTHGVKAKIGGDEAQPKLAIDERWVVVRLPACAELGAVLLFKPAMR